MNVLFVSQCSKRALTETRRILDQFAERRGDRTWQTPITQAGLDTVRKLLRQSARKNTAVACHWIRGRDHSELLWVVGDARQFNDQGAVPTNTTVRNVLRTEDENAWHHLPLITALSALAALLHDLGKATIPLDILNKPGKLTDAEFAVVRHHPVAGWEMLREGGKTESAVLDACRHHHEKMDGSGYPKGLKGDEISLMAKMNAVCDVYDAITSNRPYKAGWDPAESLRKMAEWANGHFDGKVFQAFVKSLGIYPIGSLVKLTSGRLGVVVSQTTKSLTTPCVKVFYSTKSSMRIVPEVIDLSSDKTNEKIANREDPTKWNFADLNSLWSGLPGMA